MSKSNDRILGRDDLIVSSYTLSGAPVFEPPRFSFAERVAAAAKAGFAGIGVAIEDYAACRERGMSDAEMRRILDDHGIRAAESWNSCRTGGTTTSVAAAHEPTRLFFMRRPTP